MRALLLMISLLATQAHAESYLVNGKAASKVEALTALLTNSKAQVIKCNEQELTPKATMKNKKAAK